MSADQWGHQAAPRDGMDDVLDDLFTAADDDLKSSLGPVLNVVAGIEAILGHDAIVGHDVVPVVTGSLLAYLVPADRQFLLSQGVRRFFPAGELLMRQGDPADHVLVLLSGWVRIITSTSSSQDVLVALRGPGDMIGERAALDGKPRTARVQALEKVAAIQMPSGQFAACLRARPTIAMAVIKQMSDQLHEAEGTRINFATVDVTQQVATYLMRLAQQHGVREQGGLALHIPLTQQDIANQVGASRRAVARSIAALRNDRIVSTSRRRLVVLLPDVLDLLARTEISTLHR